MENNSSITLNHNNNNQKNSCLKNDGDSNIIRFLTTKVQVRASEAKTKNEAELLLSHLGKK